MIKFCECCGQEFEVVIGRGHKNRITCYTCTSGNYKLTWRNKHLKRAYGLTRFELLQKFNKQGGNCSSCGVLMNFENVNTKAGEKRDGLGVVVDHCHETNKVRGLVCFHCNTALGHLFSDVNKIKGLLKYMENYSEGDGYA